MNSISRMTVLLMLIALNSGITKASASEGFFQNIKDLSWEEGRVRIEGQGWGGIRSGRKSRSDDWSVVGTVEKEFALSQRLTVGARAIPLFFYDEYVTGNEIWAAGGGIALRWYTQEAMDGWFVEGYESLIGQSDTFHGNHGSLNFMSEVGVGYEFDNNWHITAKGRHLSNAGLASRNSGVNNIGIAVGFSF